MYILLLIGTIVIMSHRVFITHKRVAYIIDIICKALSGYRYDLFQLFICIYHTSSNHIRTEYAFAPIRQLSILFPYKILGSFLEPYIHRMMFIGTRKIKKYSCDFILAANDIKAKDRRTVIKMRKDTDMHNPHFLCVTHIKHLKMSTAKSVATKYAIFPRILL